MERIHRQIPSRTVAIYTTQRNDWVVDPSLAFKALHAEACWTDITPAFTGSRKDLRLTRDGPQQQMDSLRSYGQAQSLLHETLYGQLLGPRLPPGVTFIVARVVQCKVNLSKRDMSSFIASGEVSPTKKYLHELDVAVELVPNSKQESASPRLKNAIATLDFSQMKTDCALSECMSLLGYENVTDTSKKDDLCFSFWPGKIISMIGSFYGASSILVQRLMTNLLCCEILSNIKSNVESHPTVTESYIKKETCDSRAVTSVGFPLSDSLSQRIIICQGPFTHRGKEMLTSLSEFIRNHYEEASNRLSQSFRDEKINTFSSSYPFMVMFLGPFVLPRFGSPDISQQLTPCEKNGYEIPTQETYSEMFSDFLERIEQLSREWTRLDQKFCEVASTRGFHFKEERPNKPFFHRHTFFLIPSLGDSNSDYVFPQRCFEEVPDFGMDMPTPHRPIQMLRNPSLLHFGDNDANESEYTKLKEAAAPFRVAVCNIDGVRAFSQDIVMEQDLIHAFQPSMNSEAHEKSRSRARVAHTEDTALFHSAAQQIVPDSDIRSAGKTLQPRLHRVAQEILESGLPYPVWHQGTDSLSEVPLDVTSLISNSFLKNRRSETNTDERASLENLNVSESTPSLSYFHENAPDMIIYSTDVKSFAVELSLFAPPTKSEEDRKTFFLALNRTASKTTFVDIEIRTALNENNVSKIYSQNVSSVQQWQIG